MATPNDTPHQQVEITIRTLVLVIVACVSATWILATFVGNQSAKVGEKIDDLSMAVTRTGDSVDNLQKEFANFDTRLTGLGAEEESLTNRVTALEAEREADKSIKEARQARGAHQ
jgi:hypothetical protein